MSILIPAAVTVTALAWRWWVLRAPDKGDAVDRNVGGIVTAIIAGVVSGLSWLAWAVF